jgi:hypothetical protein
MARRLVLLALLSLFAHAGCATLHASGETGLPVAVWSGVTLIERDGQAPSPSVSEIVAKVLRERGLHPAQEQASVSVPQDEEARAREVLLTDKRLAGQDIVVFLGVPAGTGRKTARGFEVPSIDAVERLGPPAQPTE